MPEPPAVGCGGGGGTTAAVEVSELVAGGVTATAAVEVPELVSGGVTATPVTRVAARSAALSLPVVIGGAGVVTGGAGATNLSMGPVTGAAGTESWSPLFLGLPLFPGAAPIKKGYF